MHNEINNNIRDFFDGYHLYQKILENNYMHHQELFSEINNLLRPRKQEGFTLLDIGCGNSYYIMQVLNNYHNIHYTGIDLSEVSITEAKNNCSICQVNGSFIHGDMLDGVNQLRTQQQKFDIAFSSFCIHHYLKEKKHILFKEIKNLLNANGVFIFMDIFIENESNRDNYLNITMEEFYKYMILLTDNELAHLRSHIESSDFPDTHAETKDMLLASGFSKIKQVFNLKHYSIYLCEV